MGAKAPPSYTISSLANILDMRALCFLMLVLPGVLAAQPRPVEEAVSDALDRTIARARAGDTEALATELACYTGVPGALYIRPCTPSADSARIEGIAAALRATFEPGARYVLDALAPGVDEAATSRPATYRVLLKLYAAGAEERTGEAELRFLTHSDSVLLADAWPEVLTPPDVPTPASSQEEIDQAMTMLFRLTGPGDAEAAATYMACFNPAERTIYRCDYADEEDRTRVENFRHRLAAFLTRVGATGYGFTDYATKDEQEGTWHILTIGYVDASAPEGQRTAYATFIETGEGLALGDLAEWPE